LPSQHSSIHKKGIMVHIRKTSPLNKRYVRRSGNSTRKSDEIPGWAMHSSARTFSGWRCSRSIKIFASTYPCTPSHSRKGATGADLNITSRVSWKITLRILWQPLCTFFKLTIRVAVDQYSFAKNEGETGNNARFNLKLGCHSTLLRSEKPFRHYPRRHTFSAMFPER